MSRLAELDELVRRLEGLLTSLEAGGDASASWARCSAAFERLRAGLEGSAEPLGDAERARMRDVLRLQAVAASSVGRLRDDLLAELRHVRASSERLREALQAAEAGGSCDVRG